MKILVSVSVADMLVLIHRYRYRQKYRLGEYICIGIGIGWTHIGPTLIIMDQNNPICTQYWSTKVEFQGRGAGHNHGTMDINKIELTHVDQNERWVGLANLVELSGKKGVAQSLKKVLEEYHLHEKLWKETNL